MAEGSRGSNTESGRPNAQQVTTAEILATISESVTRTGAPVAATRDIAEQLPIKQQTVRRRLKRLAEHEEIGTLDTGGGRVWWLPEDDESGGEVDTEFLKADSIDYDQLDPANVPPSIAMEIAAERLPEYQQPTFWDRAKKDGQLGLTVGGGAVILGLSAVLFGWEVLASPVLEIAIALGFLVGAAGVLAMVLGIIGAQLEKLGLAPEEPFDGMWESLQAYWP